MRSATPDSGNTPVCVVVRLPELGRYEAHQPGDDRVMGWLNYRIEGAVMVISSTTTVPEFRGRGVASELTRTALDDAVAQGLSVDALCWYVAEFIERNPRYYSLQV